MTTPILMPALSPTMEVGKLVKWHVKEGDAVRSGDVIAEIETDKATMEVEAVDEGRIGKLLVAEGTEHVPVNQPIATLLTDDDSAASEGTRCNQHLLHSPSTQQERDHAVSAEFVMHKIAEQIRANGGNGHDKRIFASPLARRLASERSIELTALTGSGPHGRIVKSDVERAVSAAPRAAPVHPESIVREPTDAAPLEAEALEIGVAPRQRDIVEWREAARGDVRRQGARSLRAWLVRARAARHHAPLHCRAAHPVEADHPAFLSRHRLRHRRAACSPHAPERLAPQDGPRAFKLSVNDFIIKALAMALQTVPGRQLHLDRQTVSCAIAPPTSPWRSRSKAAACSPP